MSILKEDVKDKFGKWAEYVDLKTRHSFKILTRSFLKCCFGFNHQGTRDRMINGYKSDKCVMCGDVETWIHAITCPKLDKEREMFFKKLKNKTIKLSKNCENLESKALNFGNNIKKALQGVEVDNYFQKVIGSKPLFRGYIIKS